MSGFQASARIVSGAISSASTPAGSIPARPFSSPASVADADKWKGSGDARRKNVSFGIKPASLGDNIDVDLYVTIHNYQKTNNYLGLTYAQS